MTEPLKEQSRMIAKELSWKPTEREELIEIMQKQLKYHFLKSKTDGWVEFLGNPDNFINDLTRAFLEWHKKERKEWYDFHEKSMEILADNLNKQRVAELKEMEKLYADTRRTRNA